MSSAAPSIHTCLHFFSLIAVTLNNPHNKNSFYSRYFWVRHYLQPKELKFLFLNTWIGQQQVDLAVATMNLPIKSGLNLADTQT